MITRQQIDSLDPIIKVFLELKSSIGSKRAISKMRLIERELIDLDIQKGSTAWVNVFTRALAAADILSTKQLIKMIEDALEEFSFQERGF